MASGRISLRRPNVHTGTYLREATEQFSGIPASFAPSFALPSHRPRESVCQFQASREQNLPPPHPPNYFRLGKRSSEAFGVGGRSAPVTLTPLRKQDSLNSASDCSFMPAMKKVPKTQALNIRELRIWCFLCSLCFIHLCTPYDGRQPPLLNRDRMIAYWSGTDNQYSPQLSVFLATIMRTHISVSICLKQ